MRSSRTITVLLLASLVVACSGGNSDSDDSTPTPTLTVAPTEWSVPAGGAAKQFTATLTGSSAALEWSIETAGTASEVGTVVAGLYTPPPSLATGRDVVVKAAAGTLVARATVHVGAGADGITLNVTPATATVVAGSGDTVALLADTNYVGTIAWSMAPALGTLDAATGTNVSYAAPSSFVMWDTDVVVTATAGALSDSTAITVHPTALVVTGPTSVHAGDAAVEFTLATDVDGNAVAWSLEPASVGSVTGAGAVGTFTPAPTIGASTPFQVVATVGGATGRASAMLLPPAVPVTINGTVVNHEGKPYVGAKVVIGAQTATSGPGGAFSIASVVPPYDVMVIAEQNPTKVIVFRGVSSETPVLAFVHLDPYRTATVTGTVTLNGVGVPGAVVFGRFNSTTVYDPGGAYALDTIWFGEASATVNHRAWVVGHDSTTHHPNAYWTGSRDVAVTAGGTTSGQDIAVAALATGHVTWSLDAEQGAAFGGGFDRFTIGTYFADGTSQTVYSAGLVEMGNAGYDEVIPVLPDGTVRLELNTGDYTHGAGSASAAVVPGQNGVALVVPAMPVATAPASGASGVGYATLFTWTHAGTGGMDGVGIDCTGVTYTIYGGERSATIPDLTAQGIAPSIGSCTWSPFWDSTTIDEQVQGPAAVAALPLLRSSLGVERTFTFNP